MPTLTITKAMRTDPAGTEVAWKPQARGRVPVGAELFAQELRDIYAETGQIDPAELVRRARDPNHLLHGFYEWDTERAAEQHRYEQSRYLLRAIVFTVVKEDGTRTPPMRYVVSVRHDEDAEPGSRSHSYVPLNVVMGETELRRRHLREALMSALALRDKYRHLHEYADIWEAIDRAERREIDAA